MNRIALVLLLGIVATASAQDFPIDPAKPAAAATVVAKPDVEAETATTKPTVAKTPAAVDVPVMSAVAVTPVPELAEGAETTP